MSTTATEPTTENLPANYDPAIADKKKATWGDFGVGIYKNELTLQLKTQQSLQKIKMPTDIKMIPEAEKILKEVKADQALIMAERKSITGKLDALGARLMESEKSFNDPLLKLQNEIIRIKKKEEVRVQKENQKKDALNKLREFLTTTKNNLDAKFKQMLTDRIEKVYTHALGDGNIEPADIPFFLDNIVIPKLTPELLKIEYPLNTIPQYITNSEYLELCAELINLSSAPYIAEYTNRLREKFSDYEVAFQNKTQALENSRIEAELQKTKIESEKTNANMASKLESIAHISPVVSSVTTKALKESYEVEMPETLDSAIKIWTAFTQYLDLCSPKLKVNKWFAFTPSQAATALGKVKSDDNTFEPAGITFKIVNKL